MELGSPLLPVICLWMAVMSSPAVGDGRIGVRFLRYDNPDGTGDNGHCCDGRWTACSGQCDHMFHVCLDDNTRRSTDTCHYGERRSSHIDESNHIQFGREFGGVANPMLFAFNGGLTGEVVVKVDVWDHDPVANPNDFVDFLLGHVTAEVLLSRDIQLVNVHGRTSLLAELYVVCNDAWYGVGCGTHCPAPAGADHYHCDQGSGQRVCSAGWSGPDCAVRPTDPTDTPWTGPTLAAGQECTDCSDVRANYSDSDGTYPLRVTSHEPFMAYCNMSDGGWTVIQRRGGGAVNFSRSWREYERGFGEVGASSEYWLGLSKLNWLTSRTNYRVLITMVTGSGVTRHAQYASFGVASKDENYALHVTEYSGDAGDALGPHNGLAFSTIDHDNDRWGGNCAEVFHSGWWFHECYHANLNGPYRQADHGWPACDLTGCVQWSTMAGYEGYSLASVQMQIQSSP